MYARRDICILDDALSGLDMSTEDQVFHALFGDNGLFRQLRTTVVLVSSSGNDPIPARDIGTNVLTYRPPTPTAKRIPQSDYIISINAEGHVEGQGSFDQLNKDGGYITSLALHPSTGNPTDKLAVEDKIMDLTHDQDAVALAYSKDKEVETDTSTPSSETACVQEREDGMSRRTGDIQIYLYYVKSVGILATLVFVAAIVGFIFCISFPSEYFSLLLCPAS